MGECSGFHSPYISMLKSVMMGIWVWMFFLPMARLGLVVAPDSFIWVLASLSLAQWVPSKLFRVGVALTISFLYVDAYFRPVGHSLIQGISDIAVADAHGFPALFHGDIPLDPLQTHLFLLVLAIMYWLIVYAASKPKLWLLYCVLGVFLLALIDGNTDVHPNGAIVGVVFIGIFNLGLLQFMSLTEYSPTVSRRWLRFFIPLSLLTAFIYSISSFLPKYPPVWANPLNLLHDGLGTGTDSSVHMVGYQLNDSRLGGSFLLDQTPVLSVIENGPAYLRGQCLVTYTGKGWISPESNKIKYLPQYVGASFPQVPSFAFSHIPTKSLRQTMQILSSKLDTSDLPVGWSPTKIDFMPGVGNRALVRLDLVQANVRVPKLHSGQSYEVDTVQLANPYPVLESSRLSSAGWREPLPGSALQYDLQLPSTLPGRVRTLAEQIVGNASSEYEMATRIESYLQENDSYATSDVPVPSRNEDYVDQFLFVSKKGYCNNFSSAMAVMLRTLGIPTRWVSGFTSGQIDMNYTGSRRRYIIRESDAHSWVEVFFPQYGWIPFDPTPNFSMDFAQAGISQFSPNGVPATISNKKQNTPHGVWPNSQSSSQSTMRLGYGGGLVQSLLWIGVSLIVFGAILILRFRNRIRYWRAKRLWNSGWEEHRMSVAPVVYLIRILRRKGLVSKSEVTVRDLKGQAIDCGINEQDYMHFVRICEDDWYGNRPSSSEDIVKAMWIWHNWIRAIWKGSYRK